MLKGIFFAAFFGLAFSLFPIPFPSSIACFLFSLSPASLWHKEEWKTEMTERSGSSLNTRSVTHGRFSLQTHGLWFTLLLLDFHRKKLLSFRIRLLCLFSFVFCALRTELWNLKLVERLTIWQHEQGISHTKFSHGPFWREMPWEGVQWSNLLVVGINGCNAEHPKIRTQPDE